MMWLLYARSVFLRVLKAALAYPWQAAIIALLCLSGWLYMGKADALATVAKRDATIAAMNKASKEARAAQIAMNKANTDKQTQIAKDADNDQTIRRDIANRSSRYADRMRAGAYCRQACATSENSVAQADTSAGPDAVVVSRADFDTLTGNTARLLDVKAWGDALIAEGLAVPVQSAPE